MEYKLNQLEARVQGNSINTESDCLQYNHLNFEVDAQEPHGFKIGKQRSYWKKIILSILSKIDIARN